MAQSYYEPGENRAARVRELFGRIAGRYDLINDVQSLGLHRLWKRRLISFAAPRPGDIGLDICCGTGDLAVALSRRGARVVGLDFTAPMLNVARKRAALNWVQGDALRLPFNDQVFDIATIAYGLRNLTDWRQGLAEMIRVTKRKGRIVILEFGKPENAALRAGYFAYLRLVVPGWGKFFCGDARAYAYILESLRHYPEQGVAADHLKSLGCGSVRVVNILGGAMSIHVATR